MDFFLVEMRGILEQTRFDVSRGLVAREFVNAAFSRG